jgi:hypothetical protein
MVGDFPLKLFALVLKLFTDGIVFLNHINHLIFEIQKPAQVLGLLAAQMESFLLTLFA